MAVVGLRVLIWRYWRSRIIYLLIFPSSSIQHISISAKYTKIIRRFLSHWRGATNRSILFQMRTESTFAIKQCAPNKKKIAKHNLKTKGAPNSVCIAEWSRWHCCAIILIFLYIFSNQCCGSGPAIRDLRPGKGKKSGSGIRNLLDPGSGKEKFAQ